ncbi:hypothetical protein SanaruYs_36430 [Chryseotalea sanaruensis]|uniref:Uncharacterized protein n=1 Tax=Chryseotalea sanaruensis TaxID=2482724 RepID=A0A401UEW5_9BACT|nr:hypothetical protein [Chryseotalea sanaruensis]GCC53400.1 hypothetical protein SanaruYs_36430 [Chryseotalea sanaruensis]
MHILFINPATKFWGTMVILVIITLGYFANKLTRGNTIDYINYEMGSKLKNTLINIHGLGSLIIALILPNNFVNEIDFFKQLYDENELWIAGTMLTLLFIMLVMIGTTFTFFVRRSGLKRLDD